ncbi:ABC transporter permease [Phyllobacterium brassicacearum]|uniref:ABC transporter permease n=1 Tax=Phyllobacterium brassicacearum TaxID=314235 RepID=A0A2P7BUP8_9HYPH|nr:ABC transporter permease [Phyllobacterium brassicacearum]PSH70171.1 ABC transporter permease [Phyllobacterium brassicacearum]TDQ33948.1 peptide/nickel transport system permease protein [Phyllobacterium brassicacearum]
MTLTTSNLRKRPVTPHLDIGRWRAMSGPFKVGSVILVVHAIFAVVGMFWTPYGFAQMATGIPLSGASWQHPMGLDQIGRDVLSRFMYGAHIVLILSFAGTILGMVLGTTLGLLSGYLGGWFDEIVQRLVEAMISIPFLALALVMIIAAGPALAGEPALIVLVVGLVYAPRIARIARAAAMEIATREYVAVAELRGEGTWSIIFREILPNTANVLLVEFSLRLSYAPILIGALGFLGFGIRPPTPEWGLMISENRNLLIASPVTVFGPGLGLASLVIGFNLFTDGLSRMLGQRPVVGA